MFRPPRTLPMLSLALLLLSACGDDVVEEADLTPRVAIEAVAVEDLTEQIEATGQLLARDRAKIAAEVAGRITAIKIYEGQPADAGGPARIQAREAAEGPERHCPGEAG